MPFEHVRHGRILVIIRKIASSCKCKCNYHHDPFDGIFDDIFDPFDDNINGYYFNRETIECLQNFLMILNR